MPKWIRNVNIVTVEHAPARIDKSLGILGQPGAESVGLLPGNRAKDNEKIGLKFRLEK
jgi:hypothetical protein